MGWITPRLRSSSRRSVKSRKTSEYAPHGKRETQRRCRGCRRTAPHLGQSRTRYATIRVQVDGAQMRGKKQARAARSGARRPAARRPRATARPHAQTSEGERRHLTVMFCDLVDSTAMSARLDPEDLRLVIASYQRACGEMI